MQVEKPEHGAEAHIDRTKDPKIVGEAQKAIGVIQWAFILIALIVLVLTIRSMWNARVKEEAAEEKAAAIAAANTPRVEQARVVVRRRPMRTLYNFADFPDGCAVMTLNSDASFYPKGPVGEDNWVTITPPLPDKPWDDAPGVLTKEEGTSKAPGTYRVCRKNSSSHATGVEVWN